MEFKNILLVVKDMEISKEFYKKVLEEDVVLDFGENVTLKSGICLQTKGSYNRVIGQEHKVSLGSNDKELYFEEDDFDTFLNKLEAIDDIKYVNKEKEHRWGQRAIRFYDPDMHIIEVGENMDCVIKRFSDNGMSDEEIAKRMDVPFKYVKDSLEKF